MTNEQFSALWRSSDLSEEHRRRIIAEIDMLMFDSRPEDVEWSATETRKILFELRYMAFISPREHNELIKYLEETVADRLHQLKGVTNV